MKRNLRSKRTSFPSASFVLDCLESRQLLTVQSPAAIGLDLLQSEYPTIRGQDQVIVVMDTGFDTTPNSLVTDKLWVNDVESAGISGVDDDGDGLVDNINGWSYVNNTIDANRVRSGGSNINDTDGHGTRVAGVIAADEFTHASYNFRGIAPDAAILPIKIKTSFGSTVPVADLNDAFAWVAANAEQLNIVAVQMSWGFYGTTSPSISDYTAWTDTNHPYTIQHYVQNLAAQNVLVVQAAGNSGNNQGSAPGTYNEAFTIGSLNSAGNAPWTNPGGPPGYTGSNYGPNASYVDLYTPGFWPVISDAGISDNDGATSFASPMVSGAAALLRQVNPDLQLGNDSTPGTLIYILTHSSSTQITDARSGTDYYDFVLDLDTAVQQAFATLSPGEDGSANDTQYYSDANNNYVHTAWYSTSARAVLYAKRTGTTWSTTEIVDAGEAVTGSGASRDLGAYLSLAVDGSGNPHVAYYDSYNGDLRYAVRGTNGVWSTQAIDTTNTVGYYPSIKTNAAGRPAISYYYKTSGNLKFVYWDGSAWQMSTPASAGDVGRYSSTAIDPNVWHWVIAYEDSGNGKLMYTRQLEPQPGVFTWLSTPIEIDDTAGSAAYADLAFGGSAQPRPAVSYYDAANADLKFAYASQPDGSAWNKYAVDTRNTRGLYTNLYFAGMSGGVAQWQIIYLNQTGGAVVRSSGSYGNFTQDVLTVTGDPSAASDVSAAWLSPTQYIIVYRQTDGDGLYYK